MPHNRFVIHNDLPNPLTLNLEPEGAFFPLKRGEEVSVIEFFSVSPVTVTLTASSHGEPIVSIWPGDGEVRVEKDGVDVFDLLQGSALDPPAQQQGLAANVESVAAADQPIE